MGGIFPKMPNRKKQFPKKRWRKNESTKFRRLQPNRGWLTIMFSEHHGCYHDDDCECHCNADNDSNQNRLAEPEYARRFLASHTLRIRLCAGRCYRCSRSRRCWCSRRYRWRDHCRSDLLERCAKLKHTGSISKVCQHRLFWHILIHAGSLGDGLKWLQWLYTRRWARVYGVEIGWLTWWYCLSVYCVAGGCEPLV